MDKINKDSHWRNTIEKEIPNLNVAFILPNDKEPLPGYTMSSSQLTFDVRLTFESKARWVKDGLRTPDPDW